MLDGLTIHFVGLLGLVKNFLILDQIGQFVKLIFLNFIKLTLYFQDGSGTITTKELLPILRSIGQNPTEDEILNLVIEYDVNGDGTIDFDEFLEMMQKVSKGKQPNQKTRKILDKIGYLNEKFNVLLPGH